jgi:hypothetical protein
VKIGRNQPCPCGSGKKYKRCCGNPLKKVSSISISPKLALERYKADELIRQQQQGLGRPIIAAKIKDQQMVAVGKIDGHDIMHAFG